MIDEMRRLRTELYRSIDILNTEWARLEKNLDILQECSVMVPEMKEKFEEYSRRARIIAEDAGEIEAAILEIAESGGSEESIQKAERLRKRLNEGK